MRFRSWGRSPLGPSTALLVSLGKRAVPASLAGISLFQKASFIVSESVVPSLPVSTGKRFWVTFSRAIRRRCPYCGASGIFSSYFTIKERCPACHTLFAYEDGYFLGSYVINIGVTELAAVGIVIWLMIATSLSVLQLQVIGIILAVGLPILFYPVAVCLWMVLDLVVHPPGRQSGRPRS